MPGLSCSASACHGGGQAGRPGSEHSTWATDLTVQPGAPHDPHGKAYRVLFNADSARMSKLLGRGAAHTDALCLKCHATAGVADDAAIAEGVSCAACHGPAEKWLTTHYLPDWKALSNRAKWDHGFVPTKNLVARISNCATCHVGAADREVNHDLIAAGHPRLAFEYGRFHFQPDYRKHWSEATPQPDFEVRAWAVGQAASLRAAVELVRTRAERAAKHDANTPWPEFSEGSCYACHQDVVRDPFPTDGGPALRGAQGGRAREKSGAVPWQTWYASTAGATDLHGLIVPGGGGAIDLKALRTEMEKRSPDPRKVVKLADDALALLDARLAAWQAAEDAGTLAKLTPERSREVGRRLTAGALDDKDELTDYDWDFVAQRYLGLAALYHANGGTGPVAGWRPPLDQLRAALAFPRSAGGTRFDSPRAYQPKNAAAPLAELSRSTR